MGEKASEPCRGFPPRNLSPIIFWRLGVLACLLVLLSPWRAWAWGPVTHQAFGCQLLEAWGPQCYHTVARRSFVLGSAAPDAFKKLAPGERVFHTLEFAGFQLRFALQQATGSHPDFDAVAYSRGYGAHLAEDAVGHHPGGYLPPQYDHTLEIAVDTWYFSTFPHRGYTQQQFGAFFPAVVDFVTRAVAAYAREVAVPGLSTLSPEAIQAAMRHFDTLTTQEGVVLALNALYKLEMVRLDPYGATHLAQALAHLELARQCAVQAGRYWQHLIEQPDANPVQAATATRTLIHTLFRTHQCQP